MIALYMLAFSRAVTGLVFAISSGSKVFNVPKFKQTISRFGLLPQWFSGIAAILFLGSEFAVVVLMAIGGSLLPLGFSLAVILLLIFCGALISVLARKLRASCTCFGTSEKPVSLVDVWRNIGFMLCALSGYGALTWTQGQESLDRVEWILTGLGALVFVMIWIQLGEISQLFRQS